MYAGISLKPGEFGDFQVRVNFHSTFFQLEHVTRRLRTRPNYGESKV